MNPIFEEVNYISKHHEINSEIKLENIDLEVHKMKVKDITNSNYMNFIDALKMKKSGYIFSINSSLVSIIWVVV